MRNSIVFAIGVTPDQVVELETLKLVRAPSGAYCPVIGVRNYNGAEVYQSGVPLIITEADSPEALARKRAYLHRKLDEAFDGALKVRGQRGDGTEAGPGPGSGRDGQEDEKRESVPEHP